MPIQFGFQPTRYFGLKCIVHEAPCLSPLKFTLKISYFKFVCSFPKEIRKNFQKYPENS
jgi:hypothetical protein